MGRILALDPGTKRVGVAISDALGITAQPLEVIAADRALERISELIDEYDVEQVVVGLPISLDGSEGSSAAAARSLGEKVRRSVPIPVAYVDERFTTRTAEASLIEANVRRRRRKDVVDKVAAAVILREYLAARP